MQELGFSIISTIKIIYVLEDAEVADSKVDYRRNLFAINERIIK